MNEEAPRRRIGRPPKSPEGRATNNLTFRTRGSLRDKLAEAAVKAKRSISEEIEYRLDRSFEQDDAIDQLQTQLRIERRDSVLFDMEEAERRGAVLQQQRDRIAELEAHVAELKAKLNLPAAEPSENDIGQIVRRAVAEALEQAGIGKAETRNAA